MSLRYTLAGLSVLSLAAPAVAQSVIYGLDVRQARFYTTNTSDFVGLFTPVAGNANPVYALDFDASATTLWGVHNTTLQTGTFDLTTGVFNPVGVATGPTTGATGLTCSVGGTWYLSSYDATAASTSLYVGDVTTGAFTLVGVIAAGIIIDISIDSQGNLYGNSITTDSLYSIDTTTGAGTLLGATGQATNFAQGMDFDWATDTLYATLYTGGGTGVFATLNLTTGLATTVQVTTPLNGEMEMSVQTAAPGAGGSVTAYCTSGTTSQGCVPVLAGSNAPSASGAGSPCVLTCSAMEENRNGLMFFGLGELNPATPWAAGSTSFLCVKSPTNRTTPGTSSVGANPGDPCEGSMSINLSAWIVANPGHLGTPHFAGQSLYCQQWYRDPPAVKSTSLSNGLHLVFAP
jgi:hypothetical protein